MMNNDVAYSVSYVQKKNRLSIHITGELTLKASGYGLNGIRINNFDFYNGNIPAFIYIL